MFKNKANTDQKRSPLNSNRLHYAGESLDKEISGLVYDYYHYHYLTIALFIAALAFLECFYWYFNVPRQPITALIISAATIPYCYMKMKKIENLIQNAKLGRDGEREVGQVLEELRADGYAIFHDIVGNGFNIDHVVVTPNGIFVVETKTYSKPLGGIVAFDGHSVALTGQKPNEKIVSQAISNAGWVRKELEKSTGKYFPVTPVLVFPGWFVEKPYHNNPIWVTNPKWLQWEIPKKPQTLSAEDVDKVTFCLSLLERAG